MIAARHHTLELASLIADGALNVLVVYWLCQVAFPAFRLVPPTIVQAIGITLLAAVLRRPLTIEIRHA